MENTGVDVGVDIGDFIAFTEKPGYTNTSKGPEDNQDDILQTTIQEFIVACKDKSLSEVRHTLITIDTNWLLNAGC